MKKVLTILTILTMIGSSQGDCLDRSLESDKPIMLIGYHPFFYGGTSYNHFVNYERISPDIIITTSLNKTNTISTKSWEEIRPSVYYDGYVYYKLYNINQTPTRHWRKII